MKYFLIYTGLRLALFLVTWAVIVLAAVAAFGENSSVGVWSFVAAVVISSGLSLKFLAGPRERFAQSVQARAARASARFDEIKTREDVD